MNKFVENPGETWATQLIRQNLATQATHLDLGRCGLDGTETALYQLLEQATHIETLIFSNSWYEYKEAFGVGMWQLSQNYGVDNQLVQVPACLPPGIKRLIIAGNDEDDRWQIESIRALKHLENLEELDLSFNQVRQTGELEAFTQLRRLMLRGNPIKQVPALQNLAQLQELNIAYIQIEDIKGLKNLKQLECLFLSKLPLKDYSILKELPRLKALSLSDNPNFRLKVLEGLPQLEHISLAGNQIEDIAFLQKFGHLKSLNLDRNPIRDFSPLAGLTGLLSLSLDKTQLQYLDFLSNLTQLRALDLSENQIKDIEVLRGLACLQYLWLDKNQLTRVAPLAGLKELKELSLGENQIENISPLGKLNQLQYLNLGKNQVKNIKPLEGLQNLQRLYLMQNQIRSIAPLQQLYQLKVLDLSENKIQDLAPLQNLEQLEQLWTDENQVKNIVPLADLKNLKWLSLKDNPIEDFTSLQGLTALQVLVLNHTQMQNLSPLAGLKELNILYLGENQIQDLSPLAGLKELKILILGNNQLKNIAPLKELSNLEVLFLQSNAIKDTQPIKALKKLKRLYLADNVIEQINLEGLNQLVGVNLAINSLKFAPLINSPQLQSLNLRDNQITTFTLESVGELPALDALYLEGNPIVNIPKEIFNKPLTNVLAKVRDYLQSVAVRGTPLNEAKLIFVGVGNVGKTELADALSEVGYNFDPKRETTEGMRIKTWRIPVQRAGKDMVFTANVWDFAGQEINYGSHQYFLTQNSVYVFVWDARQEEAQCKFDYWLHIVSLLSKEAAVFVVQNKIDLDAQKKDINRKNWLAKFPNIAGFHQTSCRDGTGLHDLSTQVQARLLALDSARVLWNKDRFAVRKMLEDHPQDYIPYREYLRICQDKGLDKQQAALLGQQLHDIGVILHFAKAAFLKDTVVLKSEWATRATYLLLNSGRVKQGKFYRDDLEEIWSHPDFDGKHDFLTRLMEKFELVFPLPHSHAYIIPELLPGNAPDYTFEPIDTNITGVRYLHFEYHYEFMPKGILSRFICRVHELIRDDIYWNYGVVLAYQNSQAEVVWNNVSAIKTIAIRVQG